MSYYSQFEPQVDPAEGRESPGEAAVGDAGGRTRTRGRSSVTACGERWKPIRTAETEEEPLDAVLETGNGEPVAAEPSLEATEENPEAEKGTAGRTEA